MNISGITEIILTKVVQEHILLWLGQILLHWDYFNKTDTDGDGRDVVVDADWKYDKQHIYRTAHCVICLISRFNFYTIISPAFPFVFCQFAR